MAAKTARLITGKFIPLTRPEVGIEEVRAVMRVLKSRWLTQGPEVEALEAEFARYVGAQGACAVSSATAALHLSLKALGIGPGDEVIVPSHTFLATVNAILHCGATPKFVDIDPETYCIDPQCIADHVTPRTACILIVHQMGIPCHLGRILEIAQRYHLPVIEDAACALGSEYLWNQCWERIGKPHGDIACFSFHPRKVISCGEGGMVTSRDNQVLDKIRRMRQHGLALTSSPLLSSSCYVHPKVSDLGYNYRLSDIAAAIARCQLRRLGKLIELRRQLAARYDTVFGKIPYCRVVRLPYPAKANYQSYPLRLTNNSPVAPEEMMRQLAKAGIETKPGIMNVHEVASYLKQPVPRLIHSESACRDTILLPLYASMTRAEQQKVISLVCKLLAERGAPCKG